MRRFVRLHRAPRRWAMIVTIGLALISTAVFAQSDDPAIQAARAETQVITDLGRTLGFVYRMDVEESRLVLNQSQAVAIRAIIEEIRNTTRLTPRVAQQLLTRVEDQILTPAQLAHTDRLWMEWERTRTNVPGSGTGPGATGAGGTGAGSTGTTASGSGSLASYVAGGPYNPLADTSRQQGQDLMAFYQHLASRVGR